MLNRFCSKFVATGSMLLVFAVAGVAQTPPPKPGPEHKKLVDLWVGDWTVEGQSQATPWGPPGKFSGKASVRSILGGHFVEWRGTGTSGDFLGVIGYDPVNKKFFYNLWGSDGSFQRVTYTIDGNTVSYSGTEVRGGKQGEIRGTNVLAPDFMSCVEKSEMSVDGKAWIPYLEIRYTRAKLSPK